jgi:molecular chaperone DnaK (HSP70)
MFVGIDLGTTCSSVAYKDEMSGVKIIHFPPMDTKSMPSVVAFGEENILYNLDAKNLNESRPDLYLYDSKRFIGRNFENFSKYFDVKKMNFTIENKDNKPTYCVEYKNEIRKFIPEEVSALILTELKRTTEESTGKKINGCVITVPAHFTNNEREATLFAAELAGLNVLQLLNEPSAAAIAYGIENSIEGNIVVFDFGGGTLDVSVVKIKNRKLEVLGYEGCQTLGGRDIDNILLEHCIKVFQNQKEPIEHDSPKKRATLLKNCEYAKISLADGRKPKVDIFDGNNDKKMILKKEEFIELCKPYFEKAVKCMDTLLLDVVNINKDDIKDVVMTGGSSNIVFIQEMVEEFFRRKPKCLNPITAIARGAAIVAYDNQN